MSDLPADPIDTARLHWLSENASRLQDAYWRMQNEDEDLRQAIDSLMRLQASE